MEAQGRRGAGKSGERNSDSIGPRAPLREFPVSLHEPAHDKAMGAWTVRQVLECASPLALSDAIQSGRGQPPVLRSSTAEGGQSKTLARKPTPLRFMVPMHARSTRKLSMSLP